MGYAGTPSNTTCLVRVQVRDVGCRVWGEEFVM